MHVDIDQLDGEYPPEPECQVNSGDCTFTPVTYLCHECGRKLCEECAIGIRHQPHLFKYTSFNRETDERVQMHCPDCTRTHEFNTTLLAAGGGGFILALLILFLGGMSAISILFGLVLLAVGGYLIYNEYSVKHKIDGSEVGP